MSSSRWAAALFALSAACHKAATPDPEPPPPRVQSDPDVAIEVVAVAGPVHMIVGRGGNIGVSAGEDGALMIDDQFADIAPGILAAIEKLGHGAPRFVINTHWHGDHTGGNPVFGETAAIIAHDNVRRRLAARQELRGRVFEPMPAPGLPVVTFADSLSVHYNGEEIRVLHLPKGHTDGDSVVLFSASRVVHAGDHFFHGKFPFVDLESGGDVEQYAANVARILELAPADAKVIPGHGPLATRADLEAFHAMLVDTIAIVRKQRDAGKGLDAIRRAGLPAKYRSWSHDFVTTEAWIQTIHASLSR
jgi:glyoxylase-like metal-dependent hydrolase (beta-lactamase superfamily II)